MLVMLLMQMYLWSVVTDVSMRAAIDKYVVLASQVFAAGSVVLNAFLAWSYERVSGEYGAGLDVKFTKQLLDQTTMKYIMMPFKSEITGSNTACSFGLFSEFWQLYGTWLRGLYPPDEELKAIPWDQTLQYMGEKTMRPTLEAHINTHFPSRFKSYVLTKVCQRFGLVEQQRVVNKISRKVFVSPHAMDQPIFICKLYNMIERGVCVLETIDDPEVEGTSVPEEVMQFVSDMRAVIGLGRGDTFQDVTFHAKLSAHMDMSIFFGEQWDDWTANHDAWVDRLQQLHQTVQDLEQRLQLQPSPALQLELDRVRAALSKDPKPAPPRVKRFSAAPVNNLTRSYFRIDQKILHDIARLLPDADRHRYKHATIDSVFKLSTWKQHRRVARSTKRRARFNNTRPGRRKSRRCGRGSLPKNAQVDSVQTDGVGLSVTLKLLPPVNPNLPRLQPPPQLPVSRTGFSKPLEPISDAHVKPYHLIASDDGRVNLFMIVQKDPETGVWHACFFFLLCIHLCNTYVVYIHLCNTCTQGSLSLIG